MAQLNFDEQGTRAALLVIFPQVQKLIALGWRAPHCYDNQHEGLWILESESTGIHAGYCDEDGSYWVTTSDGDCGPSNPLLVRPMND